MDKRTSKPSLLELQRWFRWVVTDPRGATPALTNSMPERTPVERYREPMPSCRDQVPHLAGLDVYAEAYFARLLEAMTETYPALIRSVGEETFQKICAEYLKVHPPKKENVTECSRYLAPFLAEYLPWAETPYLAELAQLEWLATEAFFAETRASADFTKLAGATPEQWLSAVFILDPALRLVKTGWPVHTLWNALEGDNFETVEAELAAKTTFLVIHRPRECGLAEEVSEEAFSILSAMREGQSLSAICAAMPDAEYAQRVTAYFSQWVSLGWIRDIQL